jgi:hypothetical protein
MCSDHIRCPVAKSHHRRQAVFLSSHTPTPPATLLPWSNLRNKREISVVLCVTKGTPTPPQPRLYVLYDTTLPFVAEQFLIALSMSRNTRGLLLLKSLELQRLSQKPIYLRLLEVLQKSAVHHPHSAYPQSRPFTCTPTPEPLINLR